jgi:hypothetical protein
VQNREQEKSLGQYNTESRKSLSVSPTPRAGKVSQHRELDSLSTQRAGKVSQHREQEKSLGQSNTESRKSLSASTTPRAGKVSQHREQKRKRAFKIVYSSDDLKRISKVKGSSKCHDQKREV